MIITLGDITNLIFSGHTHIDILKIDIEGWEFETLSTLVSGYIQAGKPLPFGQLQLEIHLWNKSFAEFLKWWETLEESGLRPFATEVRVTVSIRFRTCIDCYRPAQLSVPKLQQERRPRRGKIRLLLRCLTTFTDILFLVFVPQYQRREYLY